MSESLPRVPWRDDFALGVASIDHEHQQLVALINDIFQHIDAEDRTQVSEELGETYARIAAHFALEEQMMRDSLYDQYEGHKSDHERLLDDIRDMMDAYDDGTYADRKDDFAKSLQDWFITHFKTKDARLHHCVRPSHP